MRARRHAPLMPASCIGGTRIQATSTSQLAAAVPDGRPPETKRLTGCAVLTLPTHQINAPNLQKSTDSFRRPVVARTRLRLLPVEFRRAGARTTLVIAHIPVLGGAANDHVFSTAFLTCVYVAFNDPVRCWSSRGRGSAFLRHPVCYSRVACWRRTPSRGWQRPSALPAQPFRKRSADRLTAASRQRDPVSQTLL